MEKSTIAIRIILYKHEKKNSYINYDVHFDSGKVSTAKLCSQNDCC